MNSFRRRGLVLAAAAVGVVLLAGVASAGPAGDVKSFTGCLVAGDGVIVKVKEGNSPKSACTTGQTLARLSGGDITKISVTGALTLPDGPGTGESGDVTIGLKPEFTLPANCPTGRVAKWNGSAWTCGMDNDTTYTASTGLDLSGGAFSIQPAYRVKNSPDCAGGQFATGFDSDGVIDCEAPTSSLAVYQTRRGDFVDIPKTDGTNAVDILTLSLPAGKYLVDAAGTLGDDSGTCCGSQEVSAGCYLRDGAGNELSPRSDVDLSGESGPNGPQASMTISWGVTLSANGVVKLTCSTFDGSDVISDAHMTALGISSVTNQ